MEYKDFFFQAAVYLLAAVLSVPLAKRFGFGSVLGYLIAGIVIGPFVLGVVGENTTDVMHFAEFGVVMMLFLIGLELRPALIWQLRSQILGMGALQVCVTTIVLTGLCLLLGYPLISSFVIGMIFTLSSTAIVMQMLTEKGWLQTTAGQSSFSVLLFQDIAVIPMMAIFPLLAVSTAKPLAENHNFVSHLSGWQHALLIMTAISLIVVGARFLLRPVFRFIAGTKLREVFTAASLLIVIANALAMQALGLSPALGTFLAGVVLAESEYRHELESDIEPFKGLLLGLFFISVGANINFNIVIDHPLLIIKLTCLLMLTKFIILYILAKVFKFNNQNSLLFALSLAQGGEFCFVLLSYAVQSQVLFSDIANQLIVVVAISMVLTPLIFIAYEKIIAPLFIRSQEEREFDELKPKENHVVIAGFGRFGQIVGRLLLANKIKATILDLDSENIEVIRKFGFKVFYGDASRLDLLQAAGIEKARLFILAIDDSAKALEIALNVRKHYPHLKILARVRGRTQAYDFLKEDFNDIYRETFDSSLMMGVDALRTLGYPAHHALRCAQLFKHHDEQSIQQLFKLNVLEKEYMNIAKENRKNLEKAFHADNEESEIKGDLAWDIENAKERG